MKTILLIYVLFLSSGIYAQSKHSTYYEQRKTLFEQLPNDDNEIIFLGNSITDGCNWSELFNDLRIKNRGISGDITDGVLDRLDEVTESKPLKIFIMIGINDLAIGKTGTEIAENYKKIIKKIKTDTKETKIYVQNILPVNPDYPKFKNHTNKSEQIISINKTLKQIAEKNDLTYLDLYSVFVTDDKKLNL